MAYQVKRDDLTHKYRWFNDPGNSPNTATGWKGYTQIDKSEGYEVLYLIQDFYNERGWKTGKIVKLLEAYLHTSLLREVHTHKKLMEFLRRNFPE